MSEYPSSSGIPTSLISTFGRKASSAPSAARTEATKGCFRLTLSSPRLRARPDQVAEPGLSSFRCRRRTCASPRKDWPSTARSDPLEVRLRGLQFLDQSDLVVVLAVLHVSRAPAEWQWRRR